MHVALPRFAVMSLPSRAKQINARSYEFAYSPACVCIYVRETGARQKTLQI